MATNASKIAAQVAAEYIVNHPGEGWDQRTRRAVFAQACDTGVGDLYVEMLADEILSAARREDDDR